jgi:hypothetical protein
MGGWVLKRETTPFALKGFTMKRGAVEGFASFMALTATAEFRFLRALER